MTCLILGASGLVGWNLWQKAQSLEHRVVGTYRLHAMDGLIPLAMNDEAAVEELLRKTRPDVAFYCCGWSWVDGCQDDPERALRENGHEPARIARLVLEAGGRFVYFSTSYIFDGIRGPYAEDVESSPISVYGASKLRGERAVMAATENQALIARTMGVYGEEPQQKNFVYQVRRALSSGKVMRVPCDQWGNATFAGDLATMALELVRQKQSGVWNLAGPDPALCRSDFANLIADSYGLDRRLIEPVATAVLGQKAPRPAQGGLVIEKALRATSFTPQPWVKIP